LSSDLPGFEEVPFDPASMPTSSLGIAKAVWFRRPWFLAALALLVVVAISVVIDLPRPITRAQDVASQNSSIDEINTDLADCTFAAKESFNFYNENLAGQLTKSDLAEVPTLLTGDETACSFASEPVYDLTNNLEVDDTAAGKYVDRMVSVVEGWMTDYALASIDDIQYLFSHPGDAAKIRGLATQETDLSRSRELALRDERAADGILGVKLVPVAIPRLPHLAGT